MLPGISRETVIELAAQLGIPCREADLDLYDAGDRRRDLHDLDQPVHLPGAQHRRPRPADAAARPGDEADQRCLCRLRRLRLRRAVFEASKLIRPHPGESRGPLFGARDSGDVGPGFRRDADPKGYWPFHTAFA